MKPRKLMKEIDDFIAQIEAIVNPLNVAAIKLESIDENSEWNEARALIAIKEARFLVQLALNGPHV